MVVRDVPIVVMGDVKAMIFEQEKDAATAASAVATAGQRDGGALKELSVVHESARLSLQGARCVLCSMDVAQGASVMGLPCT